MTETATKMILYVRAWRCALVNFRFPFAILFFLLNLPHGPQKPPVLFPLYAGRVSNSIERLI